MSVLYLSKAEMSVGGREINFNLCESAPIYAVGVEKGSGESGIFARVFASR
jgi:hypothetical protein